MIVRNLGPLILPLLILLTLSVDTQNNGVLAAESSGISNNDGVALEITDHTTFFGGVDHDEYLRWVEENGAGYDKFLFIPVPGDTDKGLAIHWSLYSDSDDNAPASRINIAVVARSTGWLGFGIAEGGGMKGADIVTFEKATNELTDRYVLDQNQRPFVDSCQSWRLRNSTRGDEFLVMEATRFLDTGDTQDRVIVDDGSEMVSATRIIGAWGDTEEMQFHGENRVRGVVRLFGYGEEYERFEATMADEADGSFLLTARNFTIPGRETTYRNFCFDANEVPILADMAPGESVHIIGFEPVIDPRTVRNVHHFAVVGTPFFWTGSCTSFLEMENIYNWGPGEPPISLPGDVGLTLGPGGLLALMLEIHYDNPSFATGQIDDSGVRVYYTRQMRSQELGIFNMADPITFLDTESLGPGRSSHDFYCPSSCTTAIVDPNVKLTVFREYMHMHEAGRVMRTDQIRNGQVVRSAQVDYFDFNQQGAFAVTQEPYEIWPGDSFRTRCSYDASDHTRYFGFGSQDEMCVNFFWYYPKQVKSLFPLACGLLQEFVPGFPLLENCIVEYNASSNLAEADWGRTFGQPIDDEQCMKPPRKTYYSFDCFSGDMQVDVRDRGMVTMRDLQVGDKVRVSNGPNVTDDNEKRYEPVYAFAHHDTNTTTSYLRFLPSGLEVTRNHLLWIEEEDKQNHGSSDDFVSVPAFRVEVGNILVGTDTPVTSIVRVDRTGHYAPLTRTGTIAVNGALASCYVAFQESSKLRMWGRGTSWTYHWLEHTFLTPLRWYCGIFGCPDQSFSNDGIWDLLVMPKRAWEGILDWE